MTDIAILGAGGFGREVNLIIQQLIKKYNDYNFLGFFDEVDKTKEFGKLYLGDLNRLNSWEESIAISVAVGDGRLRKDLVNRITNKKIHYAKLISPFAILNDVMEIGRGSIICAGANFTTNIKVDDFVVVNLNATIGHDCHLSDYSSVMPGANLAGNVLLKNAAFVGSGANVLNGIILGESSILGAGAVLTTDLNSHKTAIGIPAKIK